MLVNIVEIVVALLLVLVILLQMQGSGLSSAFGGSGEMFRSKRSLDKFLIGATVILTIIFAGISILLLIR